MIQSGKPEQAQQACLEIVFGFSQGKFPKALIYAPGTPGFRSTWREIVKAADEANDPGRFTAFIGYEWTSLVAGNNLHRNVIFRDDGTKASLVEPYTTTPPLGSPNPRDLWKWMAAYEEKTGGELLAIAHNGNLSNGTMFPIIESFTGKRIDREYAETREKWERLYEATQMKGDGETHPFLSPNDEFANFERWDKGNLDLSEKKKPEMLEFEYVRSASRTASSWKRSSASTPTSSAWSAAPTRTPASRPPTRTTSSARSPASEPSATRAEHPFMTNPKLGLKIMGWETSASGYAAVWAQENTRESIFDAMKRKETYATTGPRMVVRFFGGFDFEAADANNRMPAKIGYTKGVPMGGDLTRRAGGQSADLPRRRAEGSRSARTSTASRSSRAGSTRRARRTRRSMTWRGAATASPAPTASCRRSATPWTCRTRPGRNTIGAPELIAVWKDPDFDPSLRAFYYGRVIEIPTPRWTAYDAKYFGVKMPQEVPMTTTERAYTSPIWYTPAK